MGKIRQIKIRIHTHQRLELARGISVAREWCAGCGEMAEMVRMQKATALNSEESDETRIQVDQDNVHVLEMPDGSLLVYINSSM